MTAPARLRRADRRTQLLDAAAELLVERGAGGLTMEGLAVRAGVSKALPYTHFDNAEAVLVAVQRRETERIQQGMADAMAVHRDAEARLRAGIHAYFGLVRERGAILTVLSSATPAGSSAQTEAHNGDVAVAGWLAREFGVGEQPALLVAIVLRHALAGSLQAWSRRAATRREAESAVVAVALRLLAEARRHPEPLDLRSG
jgi:AcrR family transcriptional regulator